MPNWNAVADVLLSWAVVAASGIGIVSAVQAIF